MSIPSIRPGASRAPFVIRLWGRGAGADRRPCSATRPPGNAEAQAAINAEILVVAMIESPEGRGQCRRDCRGRRDRRIAIGTSDLTAEMGISGQILHPRVEEAYRSVGAACRKAGKFLGMGGVYEPDAMKHYIALGAQLIPDGIGSRLHAGRRQSEVGGVAEARSVEAETDLKAP